MYHNIQNCDDNIKIKKMMAEQEKSNLGITFSQKVIKISNELGIDISSVTKNSHNEDRNESKSHWEIKKTSKKIADEIKCSPTQREKNEFIEESREEVTESQTTYNGSESKLRKTRDEHKVANTWGKKRYNKLYFTIPCRK